MTDATGGLGSKRAAEGLRKTRLTVDRQAGRLVPGANVAVLFPASAKYEYVLSEIVQFWTANYLRVANHQCGTQECTGRLSAQELICHASEA